MKGWKMAVSLACWTVLLFLWGFAAQAAGFSPSLSVEEGEPGDVVEVTIPYDGSWGEIAAFRVDVEFDPEVFQFVRFQSSEAVTQGTVTTLESSGKVAGVYTAPGDGPYMTEGESITLRFRVMEEAPSGSCFLYVSLYQIATPEPEPVSENVDVSLSFRVPEPLSSDARLLSLVPDHGTLEPDFDPDQFVYYVTVPYEVDTMTFIAEPVAGALCRVNRKNLGAGGSDTIFTITVTAEDGETKNIYQVTVHRQEKEEEEDPDLSDDARLLSLTPETGTLSPAFSPDQLSYTLTVPFSVTTMSFNAEPVEGASYRVNRKNLGAGGSDTLFTITVTAEDGETKTVYQVTVHRQEKEEDEDPVLSSDAILLSLTPSSGVLNPAFSSEQLVYTITVPFSVTTMSFTAEPVEGASYRVNRKNLGAGGSDTLFTITVTAEDGETKTIYRVTVHRQEKSSSSSSSGDSSGSSSGGSSNGSSGSSKPSSTDSSGENNGGDMSQEESSDETSQPSENNVAAVAGVVNDSGTGSGGETGGNPFSGLMYRNGDESLVPGMMAMLCFVLFCFLSEPLAKALARRFPAKEKNDPASKDDPPNSR